MKYGWRKVKEENETFFTIRTAPTQLIRFIEKQAGMEPGTLKSYTVFNPYTKYSSIDEKSNEIFTKYTDIKGINNLMADTYQLAVLNIGAKLKDLKPGKKDKACNEMLDLASLIVHKNTSKNGGYKTQYTEEAQQDFVHLAMFAAESRNEELINIVNQSIDEAFEIAYDFHKKSKGFILK